MKEAPRLLGDHLREHRVRVTDGAHRHAGAEVEVAAPIDVEQLTAAAACEDARLQVQARKIGAIQDVLLGASRVHRSLMDLHDWMDSVCLVVRLVCGNAVDEDCSGARNFTRSS